MAGTWPSLDCSDLTTRVRTYLNEVVSDFYTDADIYRWLSIGAKDIAEKTLCVRRILWAKTANGVRNVATNAYKVLHVEYIPSSGRERMLTQIDPLRVGHYPGVTAGTTGAPLFWYESGSNIGLDPIPDTTYYLRLYVADTPKMQYATYPLTAWNALWTTSGAGTWDNGAASDSWSGAYPNSGIITLTTPGLASGVTYNFTITISAISNCVLTLTAGTVAGCYVVNKTGIFSFTITTASTALTITASAVASGSSSITIDDLYILKEADFASATDQTELPTQWQHLLALYATYNGLMRDKKYGPAQMLESIYSNEIAYLRQTVVDVIPDGRSSLSYK